MSTSDDLPPLFTTSPLLRSSAPGPFEGLSFPKLAIPSSTSTDSEAVSDWGLDSTTSTRLSASRSPSLISSLFQSQSQSQSRSQSRNSPVSQPSSSQRSSSKPILRRDTISASADGPTVIRKRSCITFDVRCRTVSDAGHSPVSLVKLQTALPTWTDDELVTSPSPLVESDPESDEGYHEDEEDAASDEGYHEDEEDGFSSDGQEGTFTRAWATGWPSPRPSRQISVDVIRKRAVSIATPRACYDKCTRHISPPPREFALEPAPPAASSPSAADLCRRRARGWRSDDSAFFSSSRQPRKASLPDSILRKPSSIPMQRSSGTTSARAVPPLSLPRRGSACEPLCGVEHMTVVARSGTSGDPRMALHRALQSVPKP